MLMAVSKNTIFLGEQAYLQRPTTGYGIPYPLGYQVGDVGEEIVREVALVQVPAQGKVSLPEEMGSRFGLTGAGKYALFIAAHAGIA